MPLIAPNMDLKKKQGNERDRNWIYLEADGGLGVAIHAPGLPVVCLVGAFVG